MVDNAGIEVRGLNFSIGNFSIKGVDLAIPRGEYFVLTGHNGAGKSLLTKLICGLLRPASGTILINGSDVSDRPPWERNVGYVAQDGILFPNRNVFANIAFGLEVRGVNRTKRDKQVRKTADLLGVTHLLERSPESLSGGERQRVSLARAVVFEPEILIMDEPVSAIDEESKDNLCTELRRVQRGLGVTALHISHDRRETSLVADRVGILENGELNSVQSVADYTAQSERNVKA